MADGLVLPAVCPHPDCGALLQRHNVEGYTVAPHYRVVHPKVPVSQIPKVVQP